ncbi:Fic family protein [[Clostridium] innocuum]|uniref:Fic family protein n=1 Tax=Clostridium innocuum TaxID=1522 RepID=UPI001EDFAB2D|nr:Fic family protein [[Clostridium] innocuum]MCG4662667.1 Fic family protein [[Clostridium] innocuum]
MRQFNYLEIRDKKWDLEVLTLIAKIHEYKGKQELYIKQKPMIFDKLVEIAKVQSTEASNQIEGIVTTDTRIKLIVNEKTSPQNRDEEEIAGYRDVLNMIHESHEYIPIQSNYILQLHKVLYSYSGESFGGKFKNTQNYIAEIRADGTRAVRFQPLAPYETSQAIDVICESYNQAIAADIEPLLLIPSFITDFLCIHPFNDGNVPLRYQQQIAA